MLSREHATIIIGRSRSCTVTVTHPQISGMQCTVFLDHGRVMLYDMSTNGTFVDGHEVGKGNEVELQAGSMITFLTPSAEEAYEEFGEDVPSYRTEMRRIPRALPQRSKGRVSALPPRAGKLHRTRCA